MVKIKKSIEQSPTGVEVNISQPPIVEKYKLVNVETTVKSFDIFENEVNQMIALGWKPQGGIDVSSTSINGWLLTQAMVKE